MKKLKLFLAAMFLLTPLLRSAEYAALIAISLWDKTSKNLAAKGREKELNKFVKVRPNRQDKVNKPVRNGAKPSGKKPTSIRKPKIKIAVYQPEDEVIESDTQDDREPMSFDNQEDDNDIYNDIYNDEASSDETYEE